ncbi:MAG: hypothetical protein HDR17_06475 [Lachnospiraceae bacterium]|nr:hypothetical protein [Lachnospiraceae bacterium]
MRKMAGILILSLIMQLVMPMSVRAAETNMGDIISTMEFGEENGQAEPLKEGEYGAQTNVMASGNASYITENA